MTATTQETEPATAELVHPTEITTRTAPPSQGAALVQIVDTTDNVVKVFEAYQATKAALLGPQDYMEAEKGRSFIKRSGWRKLAIAFGVTFEIVDKQLTLDDRGQLEYAEFTVRAIAPNGRYSDGWGACSADERCCDLDCTKRHRDHCPAAAGEACSGKRHFTKPRHDIPATAETRAKNRAAADLFGMGEVSAEEVDKDAGGISTGPGQGAPAPAAKSGHVCPACGSAVDDRNAAVDAEVAEKGDSSNPRWKCSSKACTGGKDGKWSWASWDEHAFQDGPREVKIETSNADKLVAYVATWLTDPVDERRTSVDIVGLAVETIRSSDAIKQAGPKDDPATIDLEDLPDEILSGIYTELRGHLGVPPAAEAAVDPGPDDGDDD